jgi:hypothetical protein
MKEGITFCKYGAIRSWIICNSLNQLFKKESVEAIVDYAGVSFISLKKVDEKKYNDAHIILITEKYMEEILNRRFGKNGKIIINLDLVNAYWPNGKFNELFFRLSLLGRGYQERQEIKNRQEIREKWSLQKILDYRKERFMPYFS